MTYQEALSAGAAQLEEAGVPEAGLDAWYLFSQAAGVSTAVYHMEPGREWTDPTAEAQYREWLRRRADREPLQYITGIQQFMGLDFHVTPAVLIPRQDTETLVEYVLKKLRPGDMVLDLCTGSGCIGISLALLGGARVQAADISREALRIAEENGRLLGCQQIRWTQSDLFDEVGDRNFDWIVSNPPYIPSEEINKLMPEVRDHEPHLALDGREDGLYFYRRLAKESCRYLKPGGRICFEIGYYQGAAVKTLLEDGAYSDVQPLKDMAGLDRAAAALLPAVSGPDVR